MRILFATEGEVPENATDIRYEEFGISAEVGTDGIVSSETLVKREERKCVIALTVDTGILYYRERMSPTFQRSQATVLPEKKAYGISTLMNRNKRRGWRVETL